MYLKGMKVKKNTELAYRSGNPKKDRDVDGNPVDATYISFVRMKDCRLTEDENGRYYDAKAAPCIPVGHGGTYYGYGKTNIRKSERGTFIEGNRYFEYEQVTAYFAYKGYVYTASIRKPISPNTFKKIFLEAKSNEKDAKKSFHRLMNCNFQLTDKYLDEFVFYGKYDWLEPYLNQRTQEEKELYEGYRLKNLMKNAN
ncbi:hypothetical protein [Bacillus thuringiensis]|uniref:Uncharacterized protein n=1 Tax=Bacillus thuringiensis TaxID=1428 RepID=A0A9X6ZQL2_BACTU|nr:hypothetical protein [Bacillus thuringiensis]PFJ33218.1 hypothetical protein COJ15_28665 [Bacillus thuringiensis]